MNFESLANELILDLFEYFDGIDLFRTFYGLNSRLNHLLCYHFRSNHFNFRSISKETFDTISREYLPLIPDQILSLSLSDDDETPNILELFLSRAFHFSEFTQLQSLALYSIHSLDLLNQIILQCHSLSYFKHLKIINFSVDYDEIKAIALMNNIWSLSITHCHLDHFYSGGRCFFGIRVISSSIKYLIIDNIHCDLNVLYHLFEYTPHLRQLSIASDYNSEDEQPKIIPSSMNSLKLLFEGSIHSLTNLFQNLPKLRSLTLKISDICLNGNEWEKILVDFLPTIKIFRFRMSFQFPDGINQEREVEELLQTFETSFWLEKHQWFVQCDWDAFHLFHPTILYTLPYDFGDYFYFDTIKSKSTCPNRMTDLSYDRVNILRHSFSDILPVENSISLSPKFDNIDDLNINLPFNNHFWSCIPSLEQLKSLAVTIREETAYSQLQTLLDRAPNLYSLILRSSTNVQINLMEIKSVSIPRLDLMTKSAFRLRYFNHEECEILARSSIGKQCEVLLISVENRENICELIQMMSNLRSLTFQCKDEKWNSSESSSTNDQLIQWLYEHLSTEFIIIRNKYQTSKIHIWIK